MLTQEQKATIESVKALFADVDYRTDQIRAVFDLLEILDSLPKEQLAETPAERAERINSPQYSQRERLTWCANRRHVLTYKEKRKEMAGLLRSIRRKKEQPRQYTEGELRELFTTKSNSIPHSDWSGFVECARFLGALKE